MTNARAFLSLLLIGSISVAISYAAGPDRPEFAFASSGQQEEIRGTPPIVMPPTISHPVDTTQIEFELKMLKNEIKDLVNTLRESNEAVSSLQNRVWALENPKDEETGKPKVQTWRADDINRKDEAASTRTLPTVIEKVRATSDGKRSDTGDWIWRRYSDGVRTKQYVPLTRSVHRPVTRVVYSQPANVGWSSGVFGGSSFAGAGCAGGS